MENTEKNMAPMLPAENINFFKFGRYEVGTPIVKEHFGKNKWIEYGVKNDYPQELIRLYQNSSSLHSKLIKRTADMIAGNGFNPVAGLKEFMDNKFSKEKLDKIAYKCALDLVLFGAYYLKVIWNQEGKIAQIEHQPLEKVRIEKPWEDSCEIKGFYISADWKLFRKEEYKPIYINAFNPEDFKNSPEQLFYVKQYCPGMDYYTLPSYSSAINWIKLDYEISTFHLKNVQNGLMPGMIIINKQGIPPAHIREAEYNELKKRYSGSDNAGDFIMVYAESPDKAPEIKPIELNGTDKRFDTLMTQIDTKIKLAHGYTSALAGIDISGKLGSKNEIQEQLEYFQITTVKPLQKIVEDSFNELAVVNGLPEQFELKEYKMFKENETSGLDNLNNLNQAIIAKVLESMTADELKVMIGLPVTPKINPEQNTSGATQTTITE